jgi:uncharacterized protein (DUF433 family)
MTVQSVSRYVTRHPEILQGEPIIVGTRTSVRAIVELWRLGITPEEIPMHLPHLKLAQIFDALSFYLDNQEEINTYIERNRISENLIHPVVKAAMRKQLKVLELFGTIDGDEDYSYKQQRQTIGMSLVAGYRYPNAFASPLTVLIII